MKNLISMVDFLPELFEFELTETAQKQIFG